MSQKIVRTVSKCQSCGKPFTIVCPSTIGIYSVMCFECDTINSLNDEKTKIESSDQDKPKKKADSKGK